MPYKNKHDRKPNTYGAKQWGIWQRRSRHSFDEKDEARYLTIQVCDWCGYPLNGAKPYIDHDHKCCENRDSSDKSRHCWYCTRGFVHWQCNQLAITYFEWLEKAFGITDPKLSDYRKRFPVPRIRDVRDNNGANPVPPEAGGSGR